MKDWVRKIGELNACREALKWAEGFDSLKEAWAVCERGDWMLWLLGKLSGAPETKSRKKLVLTACECARLSLKYVKKGEERPLKSIETAEKWARGEAGITLDDVGHAAYAANTAATSYAAYAANTAATSYAAAAAYSAAASYAADGAACASYAAAAAAWNAADASYAGAATSRLSTLKKCADIVLKYYPEAPELWTVVSVVIFEI